MEIDDKQFVETIRRNEGRLKHLCRVYTDRKADRKDLFQEIVLQAWRSWDSFNAEAKVDTWLYRLAVNTAISHVRKQKTRSRYLSSYKKEKKTASQDRRPFPHQAGSHKLDQIYRAIDTLDASEKAIITMYLEDFSYAEISYVADITENYVGVKLNRIKKKISNKIETNNGT